MYCVYLFSLLGASPVLFPKLKKAETCLVQQKPPRAGQGFRNLNYKSTDLGCSIHCTPYSGWMAPSSTPISTTDPGRPTLSKLIRSSQAHSLERDGHAPQPFAGWSTEHTLLFVGTARDGVLFDLFWRRIAAMLHNMHLLQLHTLQHGKELNPFYSSINLIYRKI